MNDTFCLLLMIFFHIVDDYYLQGWLASAKQKEWWKQNAPQCLYQYDYIWAIRNMLIPCLSYRVSRGSIIIHGVINVATTAPANAGAWSKEREVFQLAIQTLSFSCGFYIKRRDCDRNHLIVCRKAR